MDSQEKLKRIMDQIGFLEKKIDSVLEQLGNRGGGRPSFGGGSNRNFGGQQGGGRDRGFRGGQNRGGAPRTDNGGNTRYAGQGPRRYNSARPFGNDENRGNFGGGANRPEGQARHNRNAGGGARRPHQGQGQGQGQTDPNAGNSQAPNFPAAEESMPE